MVTMNISDMNISWDMSDMNDTVDGNAKSYYSMIFISPIYPYIILSHRY
jgi:hypothetical protein